ncbi:MAG: MFS transporter [Candidatus Micrarchaeaceae archaeon]
MSKWGELAPYWFLLFTIGFGWFILAPLLPALSKALSTGLGNVLLIVSSYGYTMVVLGLLAGYIAAKFTVKNALYSAMIISIVGLFGRALSVSNYASFLIFGIIAAIAYPLAMAPVGSVASSIYKEKSHTIIGISVGMLFLGMAIGALVGPYIFGSFGLSGTMWLTVVLAVLAAIWLPFKANGYPTFYKGKSLHGSFKLGMIKNWYVGLAIASMSVMFGSIASTVLLLHKLAISTALAYGGLFGGLAFLGSALGAIILPPLFEKYRAIRAGLVTTGVLSFVFVAMMVLSLSYTSLLGVIALAYFLFGFFGNAYWSMAMTSTTNYVEDPAKAGFATSMYSVATNLGVAIIPVFVGVEFASLSSIAIGVSVVLVLEVIAMLLAPTLKAKGFAESVKRIGRRKR